MIVLITPSLAADAGLRDGEQGGGKEKSVQGQILRLSVVESLLSHPTRSQHG